MAFFRLHFRRSSHRSPFFILAFCYAFYVGIIMAHRDTLPSDALLIIAQAAATRILKMVN